jgi:hypothetical protein
MLSSRSAVRRLFEELTDSLDEINLPLIADEVTASVKDNPELLAAFLEEHLRPMVYEVGFSVLQTQRASTARLASAARAVQSVVRPSANDLRPAVRGRLLTPPPSERSGFDWLRQPIMIARGRQIRLEAARQHELDLAIEASKRRLGPARHRVAYYALVRTALTDPERTVGDCLDDARLAALWREAGTLIEREDTVAAMAQQKIAERRKQPALAAPTG